MSDLTVATWRLGVHSVRVSHLDTRYWPAERLTKGDLLGYYRDLAPMMLPHIAGRPITLRVYPDGIDGQSFYRRDVPERAPRWLGRVDYATQSGERTIHLPLIDDVAGLVWLANEGSIEFHCWSCQAPRLNEPDQAVFDLDPGDQATFPDVLQAALRLREALERMGLRGYPKTSGRRGIHVHLPLAPGHQFDEVRSWVKRVAEDLAASHPRLIDVAHGGTHQGSRITVDYAQNSIARTMAAPYTVRAASGAPVAAPLDWDEVAAARIRPTDLNLRTMPGRVQRVGDLFAPLLHQKQQLPR